MSLKKSCVPISKPITEEEWRLLQEEGVIREDHPYQRSTEKIQCSHPWYDPVRHLRSGRVEDFKEAVRVYREKFAETSIESPTDNDDSRSSQEFQEPEVELLRNPFENLQGDLIVFSGEGDTTRQGQPVNEMEEKAKLLQAFKGMSEKDRSEFLKEAGVQKPSEADWMVKLVQHLEGLNPVEQQNRLRIQNQKLSKFTRRDDAETWIKRNERFMKDFETFGDEKWDYQMPALIDAFTESHIQGWALTQIKLPGMDWDDFKQRLLDAYPRSDLVRKGRMALERMKLREETDEVDEWISNFEGALCDMQETCDNWKDAASTVFLLAKAVYPRMHDKLFAKLEENKGNWSFRKAAEFVKAQHETLRRKKDNSIQQRGRFDSTDRSLSTRSPSSSYSRSVSPRPDSRYAYSRHRSPRREDTGNQRSVRFMDNIKCHRCGQMGHMQRNCPQSELKDPNSVPLGVPSSTITVSNLLGKPDEDTLESDGKVHIVRLGEDGIEITHEELPDYVDTDNLIEEYCPPRVSYANPSVNRRPYAKISIDGVAFQALTDLGSERIVIGDKHVKQINEKRRREGKPDKKLKENWERLSGLHNTTGTEKELCTAALMKFGDFHSYERITILGKVSEVILSASFLEAAKATMDWPRRTMVANRKGIFRSKELSVKNGIPIVNTPEVKDNREDYQEVKLVTLRPYELVPVSSLRIQESGVVCNSKIAAIGDANTCFVMNTTMKEVIMRKDGNFSLEEEMIHERLINWDKEDPTIINPQ